MRDMVKRKAYLKARYLAKREELLARQKAYYWEHVEAERARARGYAQARPDRIRAKGKAYREANPEKVSARLKAYREANREALSAKKKAYVKANHALVRSQSKASYLKHRDERLAKMKKDYEENRDLRRAQNKAWHDAHPGWRKQYQAEHLEEDRAKSSRRRATKKGNGGSVTKADLLAQLARQKGCCFYCHIPCKSKYHHDHVWPIAKGGSSHPCNIVIACPTCNMGKGARLPHAVGLLL